MGASLFLQHGDNVKMIFSTSWSGVEDISDLDISMNADILTNEDGNITMGDTWLCKSTEKYDEFVKKLKELDQEKLTKTQQHFVEEFISGYEEFKKELKTPVEYIFSSWS